MIVLRAAASLLPLWLLGFALQAGLRIRRPGLAGVIGDFATGTLALALAGTALVWAGRLSLLPLYVGIAAVAAVVLLARRGQPPAPLGGAVWPVGSARLDTDPGARWIAWLAAAVTLVVVATSTTDWLTWDGWAIWSLRARVLFHDGAIPPSLYAKPGPLDFAHPEYPLGVPLVDWWLFRHAGRPDPALASFAGSLWFGCVVGLLWAGLRGRTVPLAAALATLGLALFRPSSRFAVGGTADVVVALALLGAVVELVDASRDGGPRASWVRVAVFLSLAVLAKNEGTAAAAVAIGAVGFWAFRRRVRPPAHALALLVPLALGATWQLYVRTLGLEIEQIGGFGSGSSFMGRLVTIGRELAALAVYRSWPPVMALMALGLLVAVRRRRPLGPAPWLAVGYFATLMAVYLSTAQPLGWLLATSLERVISHLVPAGVFLTLLTLAPAASPRGARSPGPTEP